MPAAGPICCASSSWEASRRPNRRSASDIDHLLLCMYAVRQSLGGSTCHIRALRRGTAVGPVATAGGGTRDVNYWQWLVGLSAHPSLGRRAAVFPPLAA